MKKFIILAVLTVMYTATHAQALEQLWDRANTSYINADYHTAIHGYDSILNSGNVSEKLYYNLGNAHFKEGNIGKSILNYNRALKLAPSNTDTKHNLSVANSYVKDKIEHVPEFFVKTWVRALRLSLSSTSWAVISLAALGLALSSTLLYLLSGKMSFRKGGFYGGICMIVIFIFAVIFSAIERRELLDSSEAIVMRSAAPVKSSPDNASKDIFILHEGTKVDILSSLNQWSEIMIADGNKGWILSNSIETIK